MVNFSFAQLFGHLVVLLRQNIPFLAYPSKVARTSTKFMPANFVASEKPPIPTKNSAKTNFLEILFFNLLN